MTSPTSTISVRMGDLCTARDPGTLESAGIGSCLVVILYDPGAKIGGLLHAMLPTDPAGGASGSPRYVDCALRSLIAKLIAEGANRQHLIAKLIGGAHMFPLHGDDAGGIGERNVAQAKAILTQEAIPVMGEETGGTVGRNVSFQLSTGVCSVETKM